MSVLTFVRLLCIGHAGPKIQLLRVCVHLQCSTLMASGHTTHDIIVYTTTPRIAPVLTLTGQHGRTPWCLTFDPKNADVLYSGCLGGRLCHWDVKV